MPGYENRLHMHSRKLTLKGHQNVKIMAGKQWHKIKTFVWHLQEFYTKVNFINLVHWHILDYYMLQFLSPLRDKQKYKVQSNLTGCG